MISYVYEIMNDRTGKKYIGSTSDIKNREKQHFYLLRANKHHVKEMQIDYNNGDTFSFTTVEKFDNDDMMVLTARKRESELIEGCKNRYNKRSGKPESETSKYNIDDIFMLSLAVDLIHMKYNNVCNLADGFGYDVVCRNRETGKIYQHDDMGIMTRIIMIDKDIKLRQMAQMMGTNSRALSSRLKRNSMSYDYFARIMDILDCDIIIRDRETGKEY